MCVYICVDTSEVFGQENPFGVGFNDRKRKKNYIHLGSIFFHHENRPQ